MINGTKIICFSGSTRFTKKMLDLAWEFNKQGIITLGWDYHPDGFDKDWNELNHGEADDLGIREMLDKNHLIKIDLADEVFIVNVGGYIGDGTRSEINYAIEHNKPVRYLETLDVYRANRQFERMIFPYGHGNQDTPGGIHYGFDH